MPNKRRHKKLSRNNQTTKLPTRDPTNNDSMPGDWQFTIKWNTGGNYAPRIRIVRDQNLKNITLKQKDRYAIKKKFPDHAAYSGIAQWNYKGKPNSQDWVVLVKDGKIQIATDIWICIGTMNGQNAIGGRCSVNIGKYHQ